MKNANQVLIPLLLLWLLKCLTTWLDDIKVYKKKQNKEPI